MKFLYLPIFYLISSLLTASLIILINLSANLIWLTSQGFDISLKMTTIVRYFFPIKRTLSYSISGFVSVFVMLKLTTLVFTGAILIAGMRSFLGLFLFCLSGLLGGYLYGLLLNKVFKNEN